MVNSLERLVVAGAATLMFSGAALQSSNANGEDNHALQRPAYSVPAPCLAPDAARDLIPKYDPNNPAALGGFRITTKEMLDSAPIISIFGLKGYDIDHRIPAQTKKDEAYFRKVFPEIDVIEVYDQGSGLLLGRVYKPNKGIGREMYSLFKLPAKPHQTVPDIVFCKLAWNDSSLPSVLFDLHNYIMSNRDKLANVLIPIKIK